VTHSAENDAHREFMEITHDVKCWPEFFEAICARRKTFEVRLNDRDYREGDAILLREYDPDAATLSGRLIFAQVGYVLPLDDRGALGHVAFSLNACVIPPAETLHDLDDVAAEFGIDLRDIPPGLHLCVGCGLELDADDRNDRCEDCVTPPVECQHDPRYSREECAACGGQVSWCDKCGANLCGCPIPPGKTE
jgi:hypothetical protein